MQLFDKLINFDNYCQEKDVVPVLKHANCSVDYTYQFNMSRFNVLDHLIVSEFMFVNSVKQKLVIHDVDSLSDHEPILLDFEFNLDRYAHGARSFTRKPASHKANDTDFTRYQQKLKKFSENLHNIVLPTSALLCSNPLCSDVNHLAMLNSCTCQVTEACIEAVTGSSYDRSSKRVPGWGELVESYRQISMFWDNLWVE